MYVYQSRHSAEETDDKKAINTRELSATIEKTKEEIKVSDICSVHSREYRPTEGAAVL